MNQNTDISNDVYKDTQISYWVSSNMILNSSKLFVKDIIEKPTTDTNTLLSRQNSVHMSNIDIQLQYLKQMEKDVEWAMSLHHNPDDVIMNMLFTTNWYDSFISMNDITLEMYQLYNIYTVPIFQLSSPIFIFVAPYYYITKILGLNLSLYEYMSHIWKAIQLSIKYTSSGNLRSFITKWISFAVYTCLYFYGLWHTFEISYALHKERQIIISKITNVGTFVKIANILLQKIPSKLWLPFSNINIFDNTYTLEGSLSDVYYLWTNLYSYSHRLQLLVECVNALDVANLVGKLYKNPDWCKVQYSSSNPKMIGMKNPILNNMSQVDNPASLDKNIIVTGPNAAGKTTYVKSIVLNIILAQTLGIAMCKQMITKPYKVIHTFMRVTDEVGVGSYFETETKYCKDMITKADKHKYDNALFIMDEPMHSTPPIEGQSTAFAVCEYIAKHFPKVNIIVTTHYQSLTILPSQYPNLFINLSMSAIQLSEYQFKFPYRIQNKSSSQCIAIELLGRDMFPSELIESAIKMKNKISCIK